MGVCIFRRKPPIRKYSLHLIGLPQHPETRRIYVVNRGRIYVNTCAAVSANVDRKFDTAREFRRFAAQKQKKED